MSQRTTRLALLLSLVAYSWTYAKTPQTPTAADAAKDPVVHPLLISSGDLLDVSVFDTPELSAKARVDEKGSITLPPGYVVKVEQMTAEQCAQNIAEALKNDDVLKDPRVTVSIVEFATQGVTVIGEVRNPGVFPLMGAHDLLDILSMAGGLSENAGDAVTLTHKLDPGHPQVFTLDMRAGSTAGQYVDIQPGDTLSVARAGIIYVVGDVARPGGFLLQSNQHLTVLQAIALAQGSNRTAALNRTKIIRTLSDGRQEIGVPVKKILRGSSTDLILVSGDILFVPASAAKSAFANVNSVLPAATAATIYRVP